jgi:Mrp family chromosome partitioning ATPase
MIELGIIDLSADGRRRLASLIEKWTWVSPDSRVTVPRVSVRLLSPEEVRFNGALDVCVIGPELIGCDAAFVQTIRQQLPGTLIVCILSQQIYSFGLVEQLGRLGIDDVVMESATADEFFRRLVLLQRRMSHKKRGRLVVVGSARGGVGATFVAAGIAEGHLSKGRKVCVVDCDVISQDLTRFLQVRPHVSEPLRLLIDQQRVVTAETVAECAQAVWVDEPNIACIPPAAGQDESLFATPRAARAFVAVLEALQMQYDVVVVDTASLPALAISALYQVTDEAVFVANRDPAGAFANRQALLLVSGYVRLDANVTTVMNDNSVVTASVDAVRDEVLTVSGRAMREVILPRLPKAGRWPCSGTTPYSFLSRHFDVLLDEARSDSPCGASYATRVNSAWSAAAAAKASAFLVKFRLRKKRESVEETRGAPKPKLTSFAEIGLECGALEDGVLVSKPVLLS